MKAVQGGTRAGMKAATAGGGRKGAAAAATPGQDEGGSNGFFKSFMPFLF